MKDDLKLWGSIYYALGILIYTIYDWFSYYGEDNILLWIFIRPFISILKGIVWPIMLMI